VKKLVIVLAILASALVPVAASADYTDAQVSQFCHAVRPGSASWVRYDCGNVP
jgi:hypothetical protein